MQVALRGRASRLGIAPPMDPRYDWELRTATWRSQRQKKIPP
jgi:hypothetical protein